MKIGPIGLIFFVSLSMVRHASDELAYADNRGR